jgi:4-diphosphocytidyl-2-C-methyl-D-erythritol kinase
VNEAVRGRLAPAKINLWLHVSPPKPDGFHPLHSLMVFADVGDLVRMRRAAEDSFAIVGPFAEGLAAEADNLVLRAREAFRRDTRTPPVSLELTKNLPLAAGLGGGSADAAATLWLMRETYGGASDLEALAAALGSDTPACVRARPVFASGRGEVLAPAPIMPDLPAVLVNPLAPAPTGRVYAAYDRMGAPGNDHAPTWPERFADVAAVIAALESTRNDLEAPALRVQPAISGVLEALSARPECGFARMSGSGATCFALCETEAAAQGLARGLLLAHPDWWVQPTVLRGG